MVEEVELSDSEDYAGFTGKTADFGGAVGDETSSAVQSIQQVGLSTRGAAGAAGVVTRFIQRSHASWNTRNFLLQFSRHAKLVENVENCLNVLEIDSSS